MLLAAFFHLHSPEPTGRFVLVLLLLLVLVTGSCEVADSLDGKSNSGLAVVELVLTEKLTLGILLLVSPNKAFVVHPGGGDELGVGLSVGLVLVRFLLGIFDSSGKWMEGLWVASTEMIAGRTVPPADGLEP